MIAAANPSRSASSPVDTARRSLLSRPRATLMIAPYSGPTTMAPTISICEFVRMPVAAMSPANSSSR